MKNRGLTMLILILLVLVLAVPVMATTGNAKVDWLIDQKIVIGDGSGSYKLKDPITRAEATKMLVESMGMREEAEKVKTTKPGFTDVKQEDWFVGYLNFAVSKGIIKGYEDNTFRAQQPVTYEEMIKMLVVAQGGSDGNESTAGYWSTPYITKAREMGILEGVAIDNYRNPAPRERIFEMVYNALVGNFNSGLKQNEYYVLITEQSGVYTNEVNGRVLLAGPGSTYRISSFIKLGEVKLQEKLLGRVVKVATDAKGSIVSVNLTNDIVVHDGPAEIKPNAINLLGVDYKVPGKLDREVIISHNEKDYTYGDFLKEFKGKITGKPDSFISEYTRIYTKNNFVIYVEAFSFQDIAVVQSSMAFGNQDIYVYDDHQRGDVVPVTIKSVRGFEKNQPIAMNLEDIKEYDVVHIYDRDKALVLKGNKESGTLDEILMKNGAYYAKMGQKEFQVRVANYKRPVWLSDAGKTAVIEADRNRYDELKNVRVDLYLDLNKHVQLLTGEGAVTGGTSNIGIYDYMERDAVQLTGLGRLKTDNRLDYYVGSSKGEARDFSRGDLTVIEKRGDLVTALIRLQTLKEMDDRSVPVAWDSHYRLLVDNGIIELEGFRNRLFKYDNNTDIFVVQGDYKDPEKISKVDMKFVQDNAGQRVRAFVLTRDQYEGLLRNRIPAIGEPTTDQAKVIVFFNFGRYNAPVPRDSYLLVRDFYPGDESLKVVKSGFSQYEYAEFDSDRYSKDLPKIKEGAVLKLNFRNGKVTDVEIISTEATNLDTFIVDDIRHLMDAPQGGTLDGYIVLRDRRDNTKRFVLNYKNYESARDISYGDVVSVEVEGDTLVRIIRSHSSNERITGLW